MSATATLDHPARWSASVLDVLADLVAAEARRLGRPLVVVDPFAGVGRRRLAEALGDAAAEVVGVELQPEWATDGTICGDATDLPAEWTGRFDAGVTSPVYGNRMSDHHDAADPCKACGGAGHAPGATTTCPVCRGHGLSWRNTYAHALRRQSGELVAGSAAGMQWGPAYRRTHSAAIREVLRVVRAGGLVVVNVSNHLRGGVEQRVVEWWVTELLGQGCGLSEVRRVPTRRQRQGANGAARVDGEVVIAVRTPVQRRLL